MIRTVDGVVDILLGGYTYDAGTGKYKIALVNLLTANSILIT
jgi:hypothetical protein